MACSFHVPDRRPQWHLSGGRVRRGLAWLMAFNLIQPLAEGISYNLLGLAQDSQGGQALEFFLYDVPKILLLPSEMIFLIKVPC